MDNLYLDMNGIVHNCVRSPSEGGARYQNLLQANRTNEDIFLDVFKYIDNLFAIIRPRKLVYFAIDGVAPRAKMNQQRSRRFRSAKERKDEHAKKVAEDPMYVAAKSAPFDSNCISPGTEFMQMLTEGLRYYVSERVTNNPQWAGLEVVLSGAEAYGEGEHKIMEYIRSVKVAGKMLPNTRHCLYGLDADLIMLALISHEPHFFLLREKVDFSAYWRKKGGPRKVTHLDTITFGEFELLSIGMLREYLALDVGAGGNAALPFFDIERVIDDFVFMLMLVGNDFLPHLPTIEIADGMVVAMMHLYRRLLPRMGGYLSESGKMVPERVELFVAKLSLFEPRAMKRKEKEDRRGGDRRHGQKRLFNSPEDLDRIFNFAETSGLGEAPYDYDIAAGIAKCRESTHSSDHTARKQKYYKAKFGSEVKPDQEAFARDLSAHYLEGVVWTLQYYFQGCQSWRWYYPYHYAPFPSDLVDIADKIRPGKLNIKRDKPFLPLQQLMSVLPPASAHCIPAPYQKLMTGSSSPIKDFYVEEFEMDLNGKKNEWEAVVLLPFVDAKRLFDAMDTVPLDGVSDIERKRNTLGESIVYRKDKTGGFTDEIVSPFPQRLRNFVSCAKGTPLALPPIPQGSTFPCKWVVGTHLAGSASWVSDMPTLFPVPHTGRLDNLEVNLFGFPSRNESLAVSLGSWKATSKDFIFFDGVEDPHNQDSSLSVPPTTIGAGTAARHAYKVPVSIQEAHAMGVGVGSHVWTHFPWRVPGVVDAIMDENVCVRVNRADVTGGTPIVSKTNRNMFNNSSTKLAASLMEKGGVDVSSPKVLVEVRPLQPGSAAKDARPLVFPVVTVLTADMACKEPVAAQPSVPRPTFSANQTALFVGRGPFFGSLCKISEVAGGKARVQFPQPERSAREPSFAQDIVERSQSSRWKSLSQVASRCRMSVSVANSFLGSVRIQLENSKDEFDLGLGVKYSTRGMYIPGYAKYNGSYSFSEKAVVLLSSYKEAFPELFDAILDAAKNSERTKGAPVYNPNTLFPKASDSQAAVSSIASWISTKEVARLPLVPSSSYVLPRDAVSQLEKGVVAAQNVQNELCKSIMNGKPAGEMSVDVSNLCSGDEPVEYPSDKTQQSCTPVPSDGRGLRLGDRVTNRLAYNGTPFGLRGCVVGIHGGDPAPNAGGDRRRRSPQQPAEKDSVPSTCTVEVVFDEQFVGGGDLNGLCSPGKGKAVPASTLYVLRPDRESKFYSSKASAIRAAASTSAGGTSNEDVNRSKAIAAAAVETYKKALKPPVKTAAANAAKPAAAKQVAARPAASKPAKSVAPRNILTKPAAPAPQPSAWTGQTAQTMNISQPPVEMDETAKLTALLKAELGISPVSAGVSGPAPGGPVEDDRQSVASSAAPNGSPKARKPRHRTRRRNAKKAAGGGAEAQGSASASTAAASHATAPAAPTAPTAPVVPTGSDPMSSNDFAKAWTQLMGRQAQN